MTLLNPAWKGPAIATHDGRRKKVLIADDDEGIIDAVSMMLRLAGYDVHASFQGAALLQMEPEAYPDLILLDIWMSGEDGKEICRQLKANVSTMHIPVILFSASKDVGHSALLAGANDFLAKPFEMKDLLHKISTLI